MCGLVHMLLLGKLTPISGSTRARASSSDVRVRRTTVSSSHRFVSDCRRRRRRRPALPLLPRRPSRAPCRTIKRKCTEFHFQYSTCIALALINPHLISSHLIAVRCIQICTRTHTRSARRRRVAIWYPFAKTCESVYVCDACVFILPSVCESVCVCVMQISRNVRRCVSL